MSGILKLEVEFPSNICAQHNVAPPIPELSKCLKINKNNEFKLGQHGTGKFEKNRDRELRRPEKPGSGSGPGFPVGTGTGNREKSGIFRNNFFTQKFYYSNYFLKKSVQFSNYFILELDLFF